MYRISKIFTFEAAHYLPHVPPGHKCGQLHGHSYRLEIILQGELDEEKGWVMDFSEIKKTISPLLEILDHSCLNKIHGLENPTSEIIAHWIWDHIKPQLPLLDEIIIWETATSQCSYKG